MTDAIRIALIHATRIAIDPIESACNTHWPNVEYISVLDESLAIDRRKNQHLTEELSKRIISLSRHAEGLGSDGILYTCSAFGEAIEQANASSELPVLKPNEAMFEKACSLGDRIAMIYTFTPAVQGMEQEFREEVAKQESSAKIQSVYAEGAREAVENNDVDAHNRIIAETAATVKNADVILLAHFSMARAVDAVRANTDLPVLSSPETAIEKLKSVIQHSGTKVTPC